MVWAKTEQPQIKPKHKKVVHLYNYFYMYTTITLSKMYTTITTSYQQIITILLLTIQF